MYCHLDIPLVYTNDLKCTLVKCVLQLRNKHGGARHQGALAEAQRVTDLT